MSGLLFSGERAFGLLERLAVGMGARPSGSEAEREAAEWIASEFRSLGLRTSVEEFEAEAGRVVSKRLEVVEPYRGEVPCEVMPLFGSTSPEGVEGDVVHLDTPDEEYVNPGVEGKVVLTSGSAQDRVRSYTALSRFRPLAIVFIEARPRVMAKSLWGSATYRERFGEIPVARVTYEDGLNLLERRATRLRLVAEAEKSKVRSRNVIGELEGSERPDEIVIVGGHYDTVLEVSGAGDNAGGTALVLELARVFMEKGSRRTMRFAAWGCEELGLLGSRDHARRLREESEKEKEGDEEKETELERVRLCVNLDVHGALLGTNAARVLGPPELTAAVKLLSKEKGTVFKVEESVYSSDGTSLSAVGVPSVSFSRDAGSNVFMHSAEDSVRWLRPEALQRQGEFIELFLTRYVSEAAAFPFERKIPEKQKKDVEEYFKRALRKLP